MLKSGMDYPPVTLMLQRKHLLRNNILVGYDPVQIRFAEQVLGLSAQGRQSVADIDLLGKEEHLLFRVDNAKSIEISPAVKAKTGVWSITPIGKGSAGAGAIVRYAASLLKEDKIPAALLTRIGDEITRGELEDVRGAIWGAVELLTEDLPDTQRWPDPWETVTGWIPLNVDIGYRMNTLYQTLIAYVFARDNDETNARKLGVSVKKFAALKSLNLDVVKVYATIKELSIWRTLRRDSYVVALKISAIWN